MSERFPPETDAVRMRIAEQGLEIVCLKKPMRVFAPASGKSFCRGVDVVREEKFMNIQSALRSAMREPESVPSALVVRTARRCEAVLAAREAENRLRGGKNLSPEEVYDLTAAGLLGQLAIGKRLPEDGTVPEMTRRLAASPWLRRHLSGTAENALHSLHSGALMRGGMEKTNGTGQTEVPARQQPPKTKGGL